MSDRLNSAALTVQTEHLANATVLVRVRGEIDVSTSPQLHDALATQIDNQPRRLIIDLGDATFLGSAGLGVLVGAAQRRSDLRLLIARNGRILRTLELTGLAGWFNVFETVDDALHW